jgi:hypothetical protein
MAYICRITLKDFTADYASMDKAVVSHFKSKSCVCFIAYEEEGVIAGIDVGCVALAV